MHLGYVMNYEEIVQEGLRNVVKTIMETVVKEGLKGNHHLYITYHTDFPGVKIPSFLKERHPHDITIVLQYQFWDLKVSDTYFEVTLSFSESHETLRIPFRAISGIVDPSVKFGLQLNPATHGDDVVGDDFQSEIAPVEMATPKIDLPAGDKVVTLDAFRKNKKK